MALNKDHLRQLRGMCHQLKPIVTLGQKGLTETVAVEIDQALAQHELIKVKLRGDRDQRAHWVNAIGQASGADLIQQIGHTACFFRAKPDQSASV